MAILYLLVLVFVATCDVIVADPTTALTGSNTEKFPYDSIRLPGDVVPVDYRVYLHPNITNGKFTLTGNVKIQLKILKSTNRIILHTKSHKLLFAGVVEIGAKGRKISVTETLSHEKHEMVMFKLSERLSVKKRYMLTILFAGHLSNGLSGFYKSSYKDKKGKTRYIATSHFEATGARIAFPCFDEPSMKATFTIIMVREKIHSALSNMPIERTVDKEGGLVADYFKKSVRMSTYLVAFVVCDFAYLETTSKRGVRIRVWAPKDLIEQARYALEVTPKILDYYEKFFRINFPLPKQDLIAIPDFSAGAMENWGLITYRLTALLWDEKKSSSVEKQWVAAVIAHELAHQWFGNLVTMKWWNDIWLNEGFADYVMNIGAEVVGPSWKIMDQFVNDNNHQALTLDSKLNSHPISIQVQNPAEIGSLFDGISYKKGGSVIRMMRGFLGTEKFLNGLASYLKKYKYRNAESDDLWESLSVATDKEIDVKKIMDTWILQMGYPVVNVKRDPNNKEVALLTQERFISNVKKNVTKPSPFNYKWNIPITFYFQNDKHPQQKWFHMKDKSLNLKWSQDSGWMKVNVDEIGFYRVNYDLENWKALAEQLMKDHTQLSDTDRSNLMNDAFALARVDKLSYSQALDLTKYLSKEKAYVPFYSGISSLGYVGGLLQNRPGYEIYEKYLSRQMTLLVKELGWKDEGTHLNKFLRRLVLQIAVSHNTTVAVVNARRLYAQWMSGDENIPANLLSIVLNAGIKYGGQKEWDYMFNKYRSTINPSEKQTLMYALTESSDSKILKHYLELTLDNKIVKSQDTAIVIARIGTSGAGVKVAQQFVKDNWNVLFKRYGRGYNFGRIISGCFSGGRTDAELKATEEFFKGRDMGASKREAKQALSSIRNNIRWLKKYEKTVEDWLRKNE